MAGIIPVCRHCGGELAIVHSGLVCTECPARIIPFTDAMGAHDLPIDFDSIPRIAHRSAIKAGEAIAILGRLESGELTNRQIAAARNKLAKLAPSDPAELQRRRTSAKQQKLFDVTDAQGKLF